MSLTPTVSPRLVRWPFAVLLLVWFAALWLLDGRQPAPWPDAAAPWFSEAMALSPFARMLDRVDAWAPLTPDLAAGSVLLLALLATAALASSLAIGVPPLVALAATLSLLATRSAWSTVEPGRDALPMVLVSVGVLAVAVPRARRAALVALLATVAVAAPTASWLVVPALAEGQGDRRRRAAAALLLLGSAVAASVWRLRRAFVAVPCLDAAHWSSRIAEVLRPGVSADVSPWLALRQMTDVLAGDVHLFGIIIAAVGLAASTGRVRAFGNAALVAVGGALVVVGVGVLPPAHAAALLLPWWAPCVGMGLDACVRASSPSRRRTVLAFAVSTAILVPVLRHAVVVRQPWTASMPEMTRAVAASWAGTVVVSADAGLTRRLRRVDVVSLPPDAGVVQTCLAAGRRVYAVGPAIDRLEDFGFRVNETALRAPMAAVLHDLRPGYLVALAFTPGALSWAGSQGLSALARVGVHGDAVRATHAVAVVARADSDDGHVQTARDGTDVAIGASSVVGRQPMLFPLSVHADSREASITAGPRRLATSAHAALVVLDRTEAVALRSTAAASPGLPVSLGTHAQWRHALVSGAPQCLAATQGWTTIPEAAARVSVPVLAASRRRPVVVYGVTAERPPVEVADLPAWAGSESAVTTFDRASDDNARLRAQADADGLDVGSLGEARFVVRLAFRSPDLWGASRVVVSVGPAPATWVIGLPAAGHTASSSWICRIPVRGRPILRGEPVVDDDLVHEIRLWARDGWHPAEAVHGEVFQWTSRTSATARFEVDEPRALVLALDVGSAVTATGEQPVTVRVNGVVVGAHWRGAGRVGVPATLLRRGDNSLSLDVERVVQVPPDTRDLGVLVRQVRLIAAPTP